MVMLLVVVGVMLAITVVAVWSVPKPRRGNSEAEDWGEIGE